MAQLGHTVCWLRSALGFETGWDAPVRLVLKTPDARARVASLFQIFQGGFPP